MFQQTTPEEIKSEILEDLEGFDIREGSFANNLVSPVSHQIWKLLQSMHKMIPIAFVDETSGEYIDKRAAEYGITRKNGTKASTVLFFQGDAGLRIIAEDSLFLTDDGYQYQLDQDVVLTDGTGIGAASAVDIGEIYNAPAGTIIRQFRNLQGLKSVTNTAPAEGGTDRESDLSLVTRLYEYWQMPATSGNAAHYQIWAKEVAGVGEAKVYPLADGPGTVKVVIIDSAHLPAVEEIVNKCQAHIDEVKPIGADVTVKSAEKLPVTVQTSIKLHSSVTFEEAEEKIRSSITEYIRQQAFKTRELVFNQVALLILSTEGVLDYSLLEINGTTGNVQVADDQVMVVDGIEVTLHAD